MSTLFISDIIYNLYPNKVKILLIRNNQQVTKDNFFQLGTSETTRPLSSYNSQDKVWNQWLAGLIDGDGSLLVSKSGYTSCEITMSLEDKHALAIIKNKLGGSIKLRSGAKAIRYRLHDKKGMIELIKRINGNIRHSSRLKQLESICIALNIKILYPENLTYDNAWFSGFFDADGTITYSMKNNYPQLTISVTNKLLIDVTKYRDIFGGNIYFDKGQNGYYKWSIQSQKDIYFYKNYIMKYPLFSNKKQRFFLIDEYYRLKDLKAYSATSNNLYNKAWSNFNEKWEKRG